MRKITLVIVFFRVASAWSDSNQVCTQLSRLTCATGEMDDGTGKATRPTLNTSPVLELYKKIGLFAKNDYLKALKGEDAESRNLRQMTLSATGLSLAKECDGAEDHPSDSCLDKMAEGGANFVIRMIGGEGELEMQNRDGSLSDVAYLASSSLFEQVKQAALKEMQDSVGWDKLSTKIKDTLFPQVKALLLKKIDSSVLDPVERKRMHDKMESVVFDGVNCKDQNGGTESINTVLMVNAYCNPVTKKFKICPGLALQNTSEFQMAFIIAHELSHVIDPCGVTLAPQDYAFHYSKNSTLEEADNQFPFKGLVSCLRSEKSVGAVSSAAMGLFGYGSTGYPNPATPQPYMAYPLVPTVSPAKPMFTSYCSKSDAYGKKEFDQVTEAFADWMGAEILPEYIEGNFPKLTEDQRRIGYSNVFRSLAAHTCDSKRHQGAPIDEHPETELRIDRILLVNPKVRAQMGCPDEIPGQVHCDVGWRPDATDTTKQIPARENVDAPKVGR